MYRRGREKTGRGELLRDAEVDGRGKSQEVRGRSEGVVSTGERGRVMGKGEVVEGGLQRGDGRAKVEGFSGVHCSVQVVIPSQTSHVTHLTPIIALLIVLALLLLVSIVLLSPRGVPDDVVPDLGVVRRRVAHQQGRSLVVERVRRVGVPNELREKGFKDVEHVCKRIERGSGLECEGTGATRRTEHG